MSLMMKKVGSGASFKTTLCRSESQACVITGEKCDREMVTGMWKRQSQPCVKNSHSPVLITEIHRHRGTQPDGDPGIEETNEGRRVVKLLLVTFSDNADHQDTVFGMYEELRKDRDLDVYLLAIKTPKVPLKKSSHTWLVDCPKRPGITKKTFDLPLLRSIVSRVKKAHFDAIWFESLHVWNLPIMKAVKGKTHIYHVIHEVIPHEGDRQVKGVDFFNKTLVKLADTIVLRNKTYIPAMVERYHISPDRVKYMELWRRYPGYTEPTHSKRVLFFGRINPYKGADNLLKIVRLCPDVSFDVVGRVDPEMEDVVKELSKEPNVRLETGYVSDEEMEKVFINADWAIVPYNSASQSGIIIDTYKYSRPVIAFNVGAIAEQVVDGTTGYLIKAGDIDAFSEKVREAVAMPDNKYDTMSQNAYNIGSKKYAASGKVDDFKKFIEGNL